jgi:hypothetical protein
MCSPIHDIHLAKSAIGITVFFVPKLFEGRGLLTRDKAAYIVLMLAFIAVAASAGVIDTLPGNLDNSTSRFAL